MRQRTVDLLTLLGLAISLAAVWDMLARWELRLLTGVYLVWAMLGAATIVAVLLSRRIRQHVHAVCGGGTRLLWLRLTGAVLLFAIGWYVNGATLDVYGVESPLLAGNSIRIFALLVTMMLHVLYLGFTHRKPDEDHRLRR